MIEYGTIFVNYGVSSLNYVTRKSIINSETDKSSYPYENSWLKLSQQIINVAFCVQQSADFHDVSYDYIKDREVSYIDTVI